MVHRMKLEFERLQSQTEDLYQLLNRYRDWVNATYANYEVFLEDNWFEDKTTIEYTLRCLDTLNIKVLAEDHYQNYISGGVWNLGDYVATFWVVDDPLKAIEDFVRENELPRYKDPSILTSDS